MDKLVLVITQADIDEGIKLHEERKPGYAIAAQCPASLAAQRILGDYRVFTSYGHVDDEGNNLHWFSRELQEWQIDFDSNRYANLKPATFTLDPEEYER